MKESEIQSSIKTQVATGLESHSDSHTSTTSSITEFSLLQGIFFFLFKHGVDTDTVSVSCNYQKWAIFHKQIKLHKVLPKSFPRPPRQPTSFAGLTRLQVTML